MQDITGRFIGYSSRQQRYLDMVKEDKRFKIIGHSIKCAGETFPVAMARSLGVMPKCDHEQLKKVW